MTTTYYLLRTKETSVGNGGYLARSENGELILTTDHQKAQHFDSVEAAEQYATQVHESRENVKLRIDPQETRSIESMEAAEQYVAEESEDFGVFEVEVRTADA